MMPVPLTNTALAVAIILLFVNDIAAAVVAGLALLNQLLVEIARPTVEPELGENAR